MILILILTNVIIAQEYNERNLCKLGPIYPVHNSMNDINGILMLNEKGCYLREYPGRYASIYEPDTCKLFPRNWTTHLASLHITTSAIQQLLVGDLQNFKHISDLEIDANSKLNYIQPRVFKNMSRLTNLSISYNMDLHRLETDVFDGLKNLKRLLLVNNGFEEIEDFVLALRPEVLPNITIIRIGEMHFRKIEKNYFNNLTGNRLKEFALTNSQINFVDPEAFLMFKYLEIIDLSENILSEANLMNLISKMIESKIPLKLVGLCGVGFRKDVPLKLLEIIANSSITGINLCKNQFDVLDDESFPYMPNLKYLDLSQSLISHITLNALNKLPVLETLLLHGNKFSLVPGWAPMTKLKVLDLSRGSTYFTLENYKFVNTPYLCRLNISFNNLRKISQRLFSGLYDLAQLNLEQCNILGVENYSFANMSKLIILNINGNRFPSRRFHKNMFYGLENLKVLLLARCSISFIDKTADIFVYLKSLMYLDLSGNSLKVLGPPTFDVLPKLKILHLGDNDLHVWHDRLLSNNLHMTTLFIYENNLDHISKAMFEDFSDLKQIDATENNFNCDCHNFVELKQFIFNKKMHTLLHLLKNKTSNCVDPDEYTNLTLVDFLERVDQRKICQWIFNENHFLYTISGVILTILITISLIIYIYRWHIRYWIFLTKLALYRNSQFMKKCNPKCYTNYEYDAFVSYSSEDRNFVVRLVSMLEQYEPFLKLCVYERDFEIGTIISENVLESVAKSRKTLLIISESYIKSQWCRWEVQVAENHRLFFEDEHGECVNDSIVMVKLGNIALSNLSPMLKYLMKTRIYLQWDPNENKQKVFWEKLRNALSRPVETIEKY